VVTKAKVVLEVITIFLVIVVDLGPVTSAQVEGESVFH